MHNIIKRILFVVCLVCSFYITAQEKVTLKELRPHQLSGRLEKLRTEQTESLTLKGTLCQDEFVSIARKFPKLRFLDAKQLLIEKCDTCFDIYPQKYTFPDAAFKGHASLEKIILPDSIKRIGREAFFRCEHLKEVVFAPSVEEIDNLAFGKCKSWNIRIPSTVRNIGWNCFGGCPIPNTVKLPDNMEYYNSVLVLQAYVISDNNPRFMTEEGVLYSKDRQALLSVPMQKMNYKIAQSVRRIAKDALFKNSLTKVILPDSLQEIGDNAFTHAQSLVDIVFPNNPKLILGKDLFQFGKKPITVKCLSPVPYKNWNKAFDSAPRGTVYYVPKGSKERYLKEIDSSRYRIEEIY